MTGLLSKLILLLVVGLQPRSWSFEGTGNTTATTIAGGGLSFNIPNEDGTNPHVNYFWTGETKAITGAITGTFQVVTQGNPTFNYQFSDDPGNTCSYPAHVRIVLARSDWDPYKKGYKNPPDFQNTRWWSNPIAAELVGGSTVQLKVPLTPDQWTNIYGETGTQELAGFNQTLLHPGMVGFSFGGGCFFGHGVNVSNGTAEFIVWGVVIGQ